MVLFEILIYSLWCLFAIWAYVCLIYTIGFFSFVRIKSPVNYYDRIALSILLGLFIFTLIIQIFHIYLYLMPKGGQYQLEEIKKNVNAGVSIEPIDWYYWLLFGLSILFNVIYLTFFLLFSNNLAFKLSHDKLYLIGISVLNISFIKKTVNKHKDFILEYVYKNEYDKKWTEKIRFWSYFKSTKILQNVFFRYIDLEKNCAVFDLHKVMKKPFVNAESDSNKTIEKTSKPKPTETKKPISEEKKSSTKFEKKNV